MKENDRQINHEINAQFRYGAFAQGGNLGCEKLEFAEGRETNGRKEI